jgi:Tfp pilus assembly protein PilO
MNFLPKDKEKRNKLVITVLAAAALLSLFVFAVIRPQYNSIAAMAQNTAGQRAKLQKIKDAIKWAGTTSSDLNALTAKLQHEEEDIASGDIYAWTYDFIRRFKRGYEVNIPTVDQPVVTDVDLLPQFPYKQVRISVNGSAYFHDFGKFVSDLENKFPHMRVVNVTLESSANAVVDSEKLNFRMDVIALVKPNS